MLNNILIVDNNRSAKEFYSTIFDMNKNEVTIQNDIKNILDNISDNPQTDCIIIDSYYLTDSGADILYNIKALKPDIILILTGAVTTDDLIKYIKIGVDDYFENPYLMPEGLKESFINLIKKKRKELVDVFQNEMAHVKKETTQFIGQNESIIALKKMALKAAPLDATILITGETGTGKEVLARMLHSLSPYKYNEFITVHCGGIPDTLLESTLFGHEKGSFTGAYREHKGYFEIAENSTIFLDEIGDTTPAMQVKLLRVLQDKTFRRVGGNSTLKTGARIIAATNHDLLTMVNNGDFRRDLYYRLNVIAMKIPPLWQRPDDIPLLIRHFIQIYSKKHNHLGVYLKPETIDILTRQAWSGNVRELEHVIERLVALSDTDWIGPSELPEEYLQTKHNSYISHMPFMPFAEAKKTFEHDYIKKLLKKTGGNITRAATLAKIPRQNLHLKINKHKINVHLFNQRSLSEESPVSISD
ncbi:sigma-54-dependent Fis family transcriptional regulator [candidate division KSB1 bacterium]|nr:sigma-54-dependent Fis family transcriptional regulator [candidate division KSB1 bacterium]